MPLVTQLLAVLTSALLYGWSFPPEPHPALAWFALAPFLVVLRRVSLRRGLGLAWLWTVAMAYTVNDWFPRAVSGYFGQPAVVGIALFLGVSTFTAALQYMGFALIYQGEARFHAAARPLLAAAAWVAADLARLHVFGGDPWALLGYSQVRMPSLVQIADTTGVHGITFVLVAVNAAFAETWLTARVEQDRAGAAAGLLTAGLTTLLVVAYGVLRLWPTGAPEEPAISVGIVQAHLPLGSQWKREFYGRNLTTYLSLTHELLQSQPARLIVWPENAMTFFIEDEPSYRQTIASVLDPAGAELVAGGPRTTDEASRRYFNSAFQISSQGEIRGRYDKRLLLPFAESFPFTRFDLLRRAFGRIREFTPGEKTPVLETSLGKAGVIVCNEGFFPEPAAERVRDGAKVLIQLANDSWLADPKYSEPAFDMVTLRAVEQRRWIIRASTSGPSALVDPYGRVTKRTPLLTSATISGTVVPREDVTLYGRVGDVFAWGCVGATLVAWVVAQKRAASRKEGTAPHEPGSGARSFAA